MNAPPSIRRNSLPPLGVLVLVALGAAYRIAVPVFDLPWNTAPLMAMAFGGALLAGGRVWWTPVAMLLASDLILGLLQPGEGIGLFTLGSALVYLVVAWAGAAVGRRTSRWWVLWSGTLAGGLFFYLLTNSYVWLASPDYAKTWSGWWLSQTTGLPQYSPPAWVFLRNSILADTIWCLLAGAVQLGFRLSSPPLSPRKASS